MTPSAASTRALLPALQTEFAHKVVHTREDAQDVNAISVQYRNDYRPIGMLEQDTIEQLCGLQWRYWRAQVQISQTEKILAQLAKPLSTSRTPIDACLTLLRHDHSSHFDTLRQLERIARDLQKDLHRTGKHLIWLQRQRTAEERAQKAYENEEQRRERRQQPEVYSSKYHSMSQHYLENRGIDSSQHASSQRELQRRAEAREQATLDKAALAKKLADINARLCGDDSEEDDDIRHNSSLEE